METKIGKNFKAVDFMRQLRDEMSALYYRDKEEYYDELKKAMADFPANREEKSIDKTIGTA